MTQVEIRTPVAGTPAEVFARFSEELFEALAPRFPKLTVLCYDGNQPGDVVHLKLSFGLWSQEWISKISQLDESPEKIRMVDIGVVLPFPLKTWTHHHRIEANPAGGSWIIDEVHFGTKTKLGDWFMRLQVSGQMKGRRKKYQAYFGRPESVLQVA